jgi:hypothetical protein
MGRLAILSGRLLLPTVLRELEASPSFGFPDLAKRQRMVEDRTAWYRSSGSSCLCAARRRSWTGSRQHDGQGCEPESYEPCGTGLGAADQRRRQPPPIR